MKLNGMISNKNRIIKSQKLLLNDIVYHLEIIIKLIKTNKIYMESNQGE